MADDAGGQDESKEERVSRELIELLNELRVALPGVQVLFAFLLTVAFSQGFASVTDFQRNLYFATLGMTTVSAVLLIAPSSYHRLNFRNRDKEALLQTSNRWAIGGLAALALAMTCAVVLIADYLYANPMSIIAGVVALALFGYFWVIVPLGRRFRSGPEEKSS
jgi:Flp pilus assembly protein TadB